MNARNQYLNKEEIYSENNVCLYTAYDPKANRKVMLKEIKFDNIQTLVSMKRDAIMIARATEHSKNVSSIYDYFQHDKSFTLVSQYIDNANSLNAWLSKNPTLTERLTVFTNILEIIADIHKYRVAHNDLNPINILVSENNEVFITDFCLSGQILSSASELKSFRAPRDKVCHLNERQVDYYSLGMLLYYVLTDEKPEEGIHYNKKVSLNKDKCDFVWLIKASSLNQQVPDKVECLVESFMNNREKIKPLNLEEILSFIRTLI